MVARRGGEFAQRLEDARGAVLVEREQLLLKRRLVGGV
jgi:hypothetical protein